MGNGGELKRERQRGLQAGSCGQWLVILHFIFNKMKTHWSILSRVVAWFDFLQGIRWFSQKTQWCLDSLQKMSKSLLHNHSRWRGWGPLRGPGLQDAGVTESCSNMHSFPALHWWGPGVCKHPWEQTQHAGTTREPERSLASTVLALWSGAALTVIHRVESKYPLLICDKCAILTMWPSPLKPVTCNEKNTRQFPI